MGSEDEEAGNEVGWGVDGDGDGNEWDWEYGTESGDRMGAAQVPVSSFGVKNGVWMELEEPLGLRMR